MIAGLEYPDAGRILIGDRDVTDLPPRKRGIAMVFQSYAVFPHLTVFENIAFGLRMQKRPNAEVKRRVEQRGQPAAARAVPRPLPGPVVRRTTPTRRGRARHRHGAGRPAHGRAAVEPRRAAPPAVPRRAQKASQRGQDHDRVRHPRPGRGAQPGRSHRRHARGPDRPGGRADGGLRPPGQRSSSAASSATRR